jgi:hypothetical protein
MFQYPRIRSALLATLFLVPILANPARGDDATNALAEANKLIEKGVPVKAIELIDDALKSGKVSGDLAAKALLMRAQAQEKLGKHAYALADYNSALWMQGLSDRDKKEAEDGRNRILTKLGVNGPDKAASAPAAAVRTAAAPAAQGSARPQGSNWGTEVQTSGSEQKTGGIGSFFSGLTGLFSSSDSKAGQAQKAEPEPAAAPQPAQQNPRSVAVITETSPRPSPKKPQVQPAKAEPVRKAPAKEASTASAPAAGGREGSGNFAIQFAALQSEDNAISEVNRIAKRYGDLLGGRSPSVTIVPTKDGGTLYKVIAEPYQRGEAQATCEILKTKNLNCMLISR